MINRTQFVINKDKIEKEKGIKHSEFLVTINPNKSFASPKSAGFDGMKKRLESVGNFILDDANIEDLFKFNNDLPRKNNLELIKAVDPNRTAVIEYGSMTKKLHIHIVFWVKHKTKLLLNRDVICKISSKLLGVPEKSLNVNISASGRSFSDYAKKALQH